MTFTPTSDLSQEEVEETVDTAIESNEVVVFMKGSKHMPQCGFSRRAVGLVSQHREEFETVDVLPALDEFRAALERHSDWETIPQVFANGEFLGGSDIVAEMDERGELADVLAGT